jgi:hypothetical protein
LKSRNDKTRISEQPFDAPTGEAMMRAGLHHASDELTDEERLRRKLDDPEVQRRIREIRKEQAEEKGDRPSVDAEELPDFLREHRR